MLCEFVNFLWVKDDFVEKYEFGSRFINLLKIY